MKLLGVFVLLFSLSWTWSLFHGENVTVSEGVHIKIQENLQNELIEIITENTPEAREVKIHKFWTKTLSPNKIRAFFEIGYLKSDYENEVVIRKTGKTDLVLTKTDDEAQYWDAESLTVDGQQFEFTEGLTFRPDKDNE